MVDLDTALGWQLLDSSTRGRSAQAPAARDRDHLRPEPGTRQTRTAQAVDGLGRRRCTPQPASV